MRVEIGHSMMAGGQRGEAFNWDPSELINGHLVMTGDSGTGKTHNLREFCRQIAATAGSSVERVHILDAHGDINVPASFVEFSQSTPYAFNPLEVNPDPHFGGVRRAIAHFIGLIQRTSQKLGVRQEAVLRNILLDVYQRRGFLPDNPRTWSLGDESSDGERNLPPDRTYLDVPHSEKDLAKDSTVPGQLLRWDSDVRCWWTNDHSGELLAWPVKRWGKQHPTIHDVISQAQWKLKQLFVGVDNTGLLALENLCRAQAALFSKVKSTAKRAASEDGDVLQAERDRSAQRAMEAFENLLTRLTTGTELDDLIRYESAETLKSILDRLENLNATGVCRALAPPFDPRVLAWRYGLRAYGDDERRIFVENLLERIFQRAVGRGEVSAITDVIIIDEAPKYLVDDSDHIICRIINEARKFGVALFLIAQSPTQFPEQVLAGVGCKVVLGLDPMYHRMAASKLALDQRFIEKIQPRRLILVNRKPNGATAKWHAVGLPG